MENEVFTLHHYWKIFRKRSRWVLFSAAAVAVFTLIFTRSQISFYQAYTTVKIERQYAPGILSDWVVWNSGDVLDTETNVIRSRTVVEAALRNINIIREGMAAGTVNPLVEQTRNKIKAEKVGDSNIIKISIISQDASNVLNLANEITRAYMLKSKEEGWADSTRCRNSCLKR